MFDKISYYLHRNSIRILILLLLLAAAGTIYNLVDVVRRPPELKDFKGGVQYHLVWDNKGNCYYVQPHNNTVVYLIKVEDCNK